MAQRHAYSQPIETYSLAPHNRNIWPSPTPTANQYKHMAQRRIIETYGNTIAGRRRRRHAWPILLSVLVAVVYPLLTYHFVSLLLLIIVWFSCPAAIVTSNNRTIL